MEVHTITLQTGKKIFLASDFHLGAPNTNSSLEREKKIVRWLDKIKPEAQTIILLGDIFDFWFEYKYVIPKGFIRFQGKLAEIADQGIELIFFTGNHDMWMFDYFKREIGVKIYRKPIKLIINNISFYLHHGDGLGPYDRGYKLIKSFFNSKLCQWLFAKLHPGIGFFIATTWSGKSRIANHHHDEIFLGEQEWLWQYCKDEESKHHFDYYIFGHRHLQMTLPVSTTSTYINLGEWINSSNYVEFNGKELQIINFEDKLVK